MLLVFKHKCKPCCIHITFTTLQDLSSLQNSWAQWSTLLQWKSACGCLKQGLIHITLQGLNETWYTSYSASSPIQGSFCLTCTDKWTQLLQNEIQEWFTFRLWHGPSAVWLWPISAHDASNRVAAVVISRKSFMHFRGYSYSNLDIVKHNILRQKKAFSWLVLLFQYTSW